MLVLKASQVAQVVKNPPANACASANANPPACGDAGRRHGSNSWVGKTPGGENGNPFQYSCLGNPTDKGAWWAIVHGITKKLDMT